MMMRPAYRGCNGACVCVEMVELERERWRCRDIKDNKIGEIGTTAIDRTDEKKNREKWAREVLGNTEGKGAE